MIIIHWKKDAYGYPDQQAATDDKETLRAWEAGVITTAEALMDIALHNGDSYKRLSRYGEQDMEKYFNGLGYIRGLGRNDDGICG